MKRILTKSTLALMAMFMIFSGLVPARVQAGFGECPASGICFYKDVYDNAAKVWKTDITNAVTGDYINFNVGFRNRSGAAINNIVISDSLPAEMDFVPGYMTIYPEGFITDYNPTDLFGSGINIGTLQNNQSIQIVFMVRVKTELPAGTFNTTNTATVSYTGGNGTNSANVIITSTGPSTGKVLVNEVNHNSRRDWSNLNDYRVWGRSSINADDQFIELYVKENGLDLTSANWQLFVSNNSAAVAATSQLLAAGASYQYFSTTGGTVNSTKAGDYLLINNPTIDLSNNNSIRVIYLGTNMDEMTFNSANSSVLDETIGRNASSLDTNNTSDFLRNQATPGRANTAAVMYEAETYMQSAPGSEHGESVIDAAASGGFGVQLVNGSDQAGVVFNVDSTSEQAAGHYRIILRAKINDISGNVKVGAFYVKYPNARDERTGYIITSKDFTANNTYRDFIIEIAKPLTSGQANNYIVEFEPLGGRVVTIDKLAVTTFSAWNGADCPAGVCSFEAENYFSKTGTRVNDALASNGQAILATAASVANPFLDHVSYGPYSASFIELNAVRGLQANFRLKFANLTTSNPTDRVARLEVSNNFPNAKTSKDIYVQDIVNGNYNDYLVQFVSLMEGSYQLRVISFANADVYVDRTQVIQISGPTIIYETEASEGVSGLIGNKVSDTLAANGLAMQATVAGGPGWILGYAPSYTDFIGSNSYLKAAFSLRTPTAGATDVDTVDIRVYNHLLNGSRTLLASRTISGSLLSNSEYRNFELIFRAPDNGRLSYRIYYRPNLTVLSDRVAVSQVTVANPKVRQAEYFRNIPDTVVADGLASVNTEQNGAQMAVRGTGNSSIWLLAGGPNEIHPAGSYTVTYYVRKSAPGGSASATMGKLQIKDPATGLVVSERYINETDISDSSYTAVTMPGFSIAADGRIDIRAVYYGSLTSFDLLIDRVEINRSGGF